MRTLQRIAALCVIAALSTWLFYTGREHQVFLDNRTIEVEGQSFRALQFVRITVDDASVELMPRDRDLVKVKGPSYRLKVEVMDQFGEEVERVIEKDMTPGFSQNMMLSMPLLAADRNDYILPPPTVQAPPPESETPPVDGMEMETVPIL